MENPITTFRCLTSICTSCIIIDGIGIITFFTNLNKTTTDRTFFGRGADRVTQALQLYRMGKIKKILITGGQGLNPTNTSSEAELLKRFLIMTGMPKTDILIEEKSVNTRENALFINLEPSSGEDPVFGQIERHAQQVLAETTDLLAQIEQTGLPAAIAKGVFADISRTLTGGKGLDGVLAKSTDYYNPFPELMLPDMHEEHAS